MSMTLTPTTTIQPTYTTKPEQNIVTEPPKKEGTTRRNPTTVMVTPKQAVTDAIKSRFTI